ncbi:MAG: Mu-like prophage major head subunit gpT family protein [Thermoguttaceae bacterium]|nr:Mu-like prophage major head subunit gpT family protein [Thermoguttaceae bacterium]
MSEEKQENPPIIEEGEPEVKELALDAVLIEAAGDLPSFSMKAYTGDKMTVKAFDAPVVVDLAGIEIPTQTIPIRLDHESRQGVGHTTRVFIEGGALFAEGVISRTTSWAKDVAASGRAGFPWQASIGGPAHQADFVPAGQSVSVNGRNFEGPLYVVRSFTLKEISFCDLGADSNTSAVVANECSEMEDFVMSEDKNLEATSADVPVAEAVEAEPVVQASNNVACEPVTNAAEEIRAYRQEWAAERNRIAQINKIGKGADPVLEAKAVNEGWSADKFELELLRNQRPEAPAVQVVKHDTSAKVLECTALAACGVSLARREKMFDAPTLEAADKLRGIGLQEFCELACHQTLPRYRRDAHGWLEAAFSTVDLPGILSNVANKSLLAGYESVSDNWRQIAKVSSVQDFKEHTRYRMNSNFVFEKVGAAGKLKHGEVGEQKFSQKADTYGIMFALTREMIINDDLGALNDIPTQIGVGAGEAIADAIWSLVLANPTQADGQAFYSAAHNNYLTGASNALSIDGLTAGVTQFMKQTKPNGRPLAVAPRYLLVPPELAVKANTLMNAQVVNETTSTGKMSPNINPHAGRCEVVVSEYLSNSSYTGYSATGWYLFADPARIPSFEIAFLNGIDRPTIERADADFDTLGVQFRGYIDFGVKEQDWRGSVFVTGAN